MLARLSRLCRIALLAFVPLTSFAALPAGVVQDFTVEGFTQYSLPNGLRVVLFPDETRPTTTVNVTYLVGSRYEGYGETGMAHLLEHMLFKGTPSMPNVFQELGRRGMRFNGSTYFDRTNYFESFPASDENLAWAIRMEAERMTRSTFSKTELDTEMTVVRNEFERGENNAQLVLLERMQSVAWDWHNYGHTTIGARSDIENVPFGNLRAFYEKFYQPDNAILVVAGKFDPDATLAVIVREFGAIPRPARVLPPLYTSEPVQDGERSITVRRVGGTQYAAAMYHTVPGPHPDSTALEALYEIMTVQPSGRLYQALVEKKLATSIDGESFSLHDPGAIIFMAQVPLADSVDAARDAMLATLAAVRDQPITEAEVARVRAQALKKFDQIVNDPIRVGVALSEVVAQGDWRLLFLQRDRWRNLKAADVQRVALEYLKPTNATIGRFIPDDKPDRAPPAPRVDLATMLKDYKGDAAVAAGEAFDPSPANLEARTQRIVLPNGMKLVMLPRKTRGEAVAIHLSVQTGDEASLRGTAPAGELAASMLTLGTTKHDRQAFNDALDAARAKLSAGGDERNVSMDAETVRAHVGDVLSLMAEAMREPAFAPGEFEKLQREVLAGLDQSRTEPDAIATRAITRHDKTYPRDDVRYVPTIDEEIARARAATLERVKAFHKRFYGASNAEIALVGDFDPAEVRAQVTRLFDGWKAEAPYKHVPELFKPTTPAALTFQTPDKANASLMGVIALPINDASPDYPALLAVARLLGGGVDARIPDRVREREGLSYDAGLVLQASSQDERSVAVLYAIYAPQNLAKVRTGFAEELARAVKDGFTQAEVDAAKQALLQRRTLGRTRDASLATALASQAELGRTWELTGRIDAAIAALTVADVNAALRKYVTPETIAYAYAGDFNKK